MATVATAAPILQPGASLTTSPTLVESTSTTQLTPSATMTTSPTTAEAHISTAPFSPSLISDTLPIPTHVRRAWSPPPLHLGPASSFPDPSTWLPFSRLWLLYSPILTRYDTPSQISTIRTAITAIASESGMDARAILCMIMQESGGNVHAGTTLAPGTEGQLKNPGLMQSHNGVAFDEQRQEDSIYHMIRDGTEGTWDHEGGGDGLKQLYEKYGNYYEALRGYNSGSVNQDDLTDGFEATKEHVSDIANFLVGMPPREDMCVDC